MSPLFPITVVVAIVLFALKEAIEIFRRRSNNQKRCAAYKLLLADEIEKNNWVIRSLRTTFKSLKEDWHTHDVTIDTTNAEKVRIKFVGRTNSSESSWLIPDVSRRVFEKIYADIPALDEDLFNLAMQAYEAVSELEHVRDSLIEYVSSDEARPNGFKESFVEYGFREIGDAYVQLAALYRECTGKDLAQFKLRSFT